MTTRSPPRQQRLVSSSLKGPASRLRLHCQRQRQREFNRNVRISELSCLDVPGVLAAAEQADRCTYDKVIGARSLGPIENTPAAAAI